MIYPLPLSGFVLKRKKGADFRAFTRLHMSG
jgi:hypothetical protein